MTTNVFEIRAVVGSGEGEVLSKPATISEKSKMENQEVKGTEEITNSGVNTGLKVISTIAVVHSTTQTLAQPVIQGEINKASVAGDYVQAENIKRTQQIANQAIGLGLEIATIGALATNPVTLPLAIGAGAMSLGKQIQQGINRYQMNNAREQINNIDNYINSYESARLANVKAGR